MHTIKFPPGVLSVAAGTTQYNADEQGYVDVEDSNDVRVILEHDPRFSEEKRPKAVAEKPALLTGTGDGDGEAGELRAPEDMSKKDVLAELKGMGIVVPPTIAVDDARKLLGQEREAAALK